MGVLVVILLLIVVWYTRVCLDEAQKVQTTDSHAYDHDEAREIVSDFGHWLAEWDRNHDKRSTSMRRLPWSREDIKHAILYLGTESILDPIAAKALAEYHARLAALPANFVRPGKGAQDAELMQRRTAG